MLRRKPCFIGSDPVRDRDQPREKPEVGMMRGEARLRWRCRQRAEYRLEFGHELQAIRFRPFSESFRSVEPGVLSFRPSVVRSHRNRPEPGRCGVEKLLQEYLTDQRMIRDG